MKHARFITGRPQIKFLGILVGAFFLTLAAFTVSAQQTSEAQFRVKNENAFNINLIQFKRTEYVGSCAGTVFSPDSQSARFVSSKTPPAPNRRVVIKNVTDGMDTNPYPYTDRSYNKGEFSEDFAFKLGNSHKTRTFSVLEGENKFVYEIKENDQVIEQGTLTAEVSIQSLGTFPRQQICEDKVECRDTSDCRDSKGRKRSCRRECFPVQQCRCP
ncbi:hypothetical protein Osc7112_1374 [Oscillatoria nigro-viridis PCC 7112]|uniref:Uncharacterized protein n=1 Tax=Phormidium nigroviride PCC 7112 TaxID=179408 RepID=K9VF68_9CYAN|nr:hypothetical protein [Oscillatoria nigro-viridis]AFZ05905.1 hypothetical protein Osc7112_1374 [Oscillatoria nigro-viridis PCC 7112]